MSPQGPFAIEKNNFDAFTIERVSIKSDVEKSGGGRGNLDVQMALMEDLKKLKEGLSKTDAYKGVVNTKLMHSDDGLTSSHSSSNSSNNSSNNSNSSVSLTSSTGGLGRSAIEMNAIPDVIDR